MERYLRARWLACGLAARYLRLPRFTDIVVGDTDPPWEKKENEKGAQSKVREPLTPKLPSPGTLLFAVR